MASDKDQLLAMGFEEARIDCALSLLSSDDVGDACVYAGKQMVGYRHKVGSSRVKGM